jgi:hypothetical protein
MSAWVPANAVERRLWDALQAGELTAYFRTLLAARLYLPGRLSDGPTGDSQWFGTIVRDGVTYLPVFTSVEALRDYAEEVADAYRITNIAELAQRWPNPAWHLAVSPNLPLAVAGPPTALIAGAEDDEAGAVAGPGLSPQADQPDSHGFIELRPAHAGSAPATPTQDPATPEHDPATPTLDEDRTGAFEPANPLEVAMAHALAHDVAELFLDALVLCRVLMPTAGPAHPDDLEHAADFPWLVGTDENGPAIAVFTSPLRLAEAFGRGVPLVEVNCVRLARAWPDPTIRLWVNPGSPITALLSGAEVAQLVPWGQRLTARTADATALGDLPPPR